MLVIRRKRGERLVIGTSITVTVLEMHRGWVRLGFHAPADVKIVRAEIANTVPNRVPAPTDDGATAAPARVKSAP